MPGEFELIADITRHFPQHADVLLGPGDDAAVLAVTDGRVLASTDLLVEGVHFTREWLSPYVLGRRAAAQNFADIEAMGGHPTALLIGLAAPRDTDPDWFDELARGLAAECDLVGASVIGGDMSTGDAVVVAVTVLGVQTPAGVVTRAGARPGDVVAVAGRLGWSALGLAALKRGVDLPAVTAAYRVPEPPYGAGARAAAAGATAMLDCSDGLLADLGHIAAASGAVIDVHSPAVPVAPEVTAAAVALGRDPLAAALTGGEDHALLATFPPTAVLPAGFVPIGTVGPGPAAVTVDGRRHAGSAGHDHFA